MSDKVCFVIMPFSDAENPADNQWDDLFTNHLKVAVEGAGLGYTCYRSINTHGSFMHDIVTRLASADVVIAVLTELRPNVMYELGVRNVLKRKTIMLVEKSSKIPSDLKAFIALRYSTKSTRDRMELVETIRNRLKLLDDKEPESDNPVSDHLWSRAVQICKEWYEKENPAVSLPGLLEIVPSYVFELEPVMLGVREHVEQVERPTKRGTSRRPSLPGKKKSLRQAPRVLSLAHMNRGLELKENHENERALKHFDEALRLDPTNTAAWSNRALVLVQLARYEEAAESARRVAHLQPTSADSWNALGKSLFLLKRFDEAAEACRRGAELDPLSAVYANNAGVALEASGRLDEALRSYESALELNPRFEHALYNSGKLLVKLGRVTEGETLIRGALEINPRIAQEVDTQLRVIATGGGAAAPP